MWIPGNVCMFLRDIQVHNHSLSLTHYQMSLFRELTEGWMENMELINQSINIVLGFIVL